jgi:hypothetical protein
MGMPCQIARIHEIVNWNVEPRIRHTKWMTSATDYTDDPDRRGEMSLS